MAETRTDNQQLIKHTALQANPSARKAGGDKAASSSSVNSGQILDKRYAQYEKESTIRKGSKVA